MYGQSKINTLGLWMAKKTYLWLIKVRVYLSKTFNLTLLSPSGTQRPLNLSCHHPLEDLLSLKILTDLKSHRAISSRYFPTTFNINIPYLFEISPYLSSILESILDVLSRHSPTFNLILRPTGYSPAFYLIPRPLISPCHPLQVLPDLVLERVNHNAVVGRTE